MTDGQLTQQQTIDISQEMLVENSQEIIENLQTTKHQKTGFRKSFISNLKQNLKCKLYF